MAARSGTLPTNPSVLVSLVQTFLLASSQAVTQSAHEEKE